MMEKIESDQCSEVRAGNGAGEAIALAERETARQQVETLQRRLDDLAAENRILRQVIDERAIERATAPEREVLLREEVEHGSNLFYIHTPDGQLTYGSPQSRDFFECEPEEAIVHWTKFLTEHPDNGIGLERAQRAVQTGERPPPYQVELAGKKGRRIWVEVHEAPVVRDGKTVAVIGALIDITEDRQAQQALAESHRLYTDLVRSVPAGVYRLRITASDVWRFDYVSDLFCELLQLDAAAVMADYRAAFQRVHPEDDAEFKRLIDQALRTRERFVWEGRSVLNSRCGWVHVESSPTVLSNGDVLWTGVLYDITARKRIENTLRFAAQRGWEQMGEGFFPALARHLAETLDMEGVLIARTSADGRSAQTVAFHLAGQPAENVVYSLAGTPGENVAGKNPAVYREGVARLFPTDALLAGSRAESYVSIPLWDAKGNALGSIAVFGRERLADAEIVINTLQAVAICAAAELERQEAEARLRENEARFRTLVDNIPGVVYRCRPQAPWRIDFISDAVGTITGYPAEEFLEGRCTYSGLIVAEDLQRVEGVVREAMRTRQPYALEYRLRCADGTVRWVQDRGRCAYSETGESLWLDGVVVDISSFKRVERELGENRRMLERMLDSLPQSIFWKDRQSVYLGCNEVFAHSIGLSSPNDLLGKSDFDLPANRAQAEAYRADDREVMETGMAKYHTIEPLVRGDGSLGWVESSKVPLLDERGQVYGVLGIFHDVTERQQNEETVLREKQFSETLINSLPGIFYLYDSQWRLLRWNRNHELLTGFSAAELQGRPLLEWFAPETRPEMTRHVAGVLAGGQATFEAPLLLRDGRAVPYLFTGVKLERGEETLFMGVGIDLTDLKRVEQALRHNQALLAEAQRIAHVGHWENDLRTHTLHWSDEVYRIFGRRPGEFTPTYDGFIEAVHPEDREHLRNQVEAAWQQRQPYNLEHRLLLPNGEIRYVHERGEASYDETGQRRRMLGTVQDVTARRCAEEALRESENRYRTLVELSPDGIIIYCEGRVVFANQGAATILGAGSPGGLLGKWVMDFVHPESRDLAREREQWLQARRQVVPQYEARLVRNDGQTVEVEIVAMPFAWRGQEAVQTVIRDISQRKRLEEQLRQAQKMEAIGTLAGGVAHDFNNLLTVVLAQADLALLESNLAPGTIDSLQQISQAAQRASALTRQLLTFSRKQPIHLQRLNLNEVIANLTKMLRRIIGEDIQLECHHPADPLWLQADAGMLEQVLLNLAVNARDAMPHGGSLAIRTESLQVDEDYARRRPEARPGEFVLLSMTDTGSGIPAEIAPRIFDPFFTTKQVGQGTGLGLATVHGVVGQHKGWIEVQSELGRGTTFRILLPRITTAAAHADAPATPVTSLPAGLETILLVEDDAAVRTMVKAVLQHRGYQVLEAASGVEALEVWEKRAPEVDLLLTDIVMPEGVNGIELASRLRAERADLKILLTSGYSSELTAAQQIGGQHVPLLQKPYNLSALAQAVRDCLDNLPDEASN